MSITLQQPPLDERAVASHYGVEDLGGRILGALEQMGKNVRALAPGDLAPVDEFHSRGREATIALAERAGVDRDSRVLDVGCGIGGSARYLAGTFGCRVTGLDLTPAFCEVAAALSERVGLAGLTTFQCGNALDMPFADGAFDIAWTEHAQMNISDKEALYAEIARVLVPGGTLALHDILQGPNGALHFPVPWADEPSISALVEPEALRTLLEQSGFAIREWEDSSQASLAWFRNAAGRIATQGPPPLGLHLLMGADARAKLGNTIRNLEEGRIAIVQAVAVKT